MKKVIIVMDIALLLFIKTIFAQYNSGSKVTTEGFIGTTEVKYWDASKAYSGYTLFAGGGKTYLIDMEGYVINQWNVGTNPRLLDNGNLLDASKADPSGFSGFLEIDWSGNTVWTYTEKRTTYFPHHDWTRIFNKKLNAYTTLYIANKTVTKDQALAAGANPSSSNYSDVTVDAIVEVDMNGNIVWEWWFFDHIVQDYDSSKPNYVDTGKSISDYPNKININLSGKPLKKDWLHCNSIDYNESLGQIVINSVHGEFYIIDHDNTFIANDPTGSIALAATSAGDFLYRFGDPARYNQGDPPSVLADWTFSTTGNKQIGGSHDVRWIKDGLPGAGNIQIFNNGEYLFERVSQSYIFEVNPYYNSKLANTGSYVNPPDAGYYTWIYPNKDAMKQNKFISSQVVWIYSSKNDQNFFSTIGGSEQRLPNGNTLICSDTQGHLFEVTYGDSKTSPTVVWEYINPVTTDGIKQVITDQYPMYNSVFRCLRYSSDHPALQGRSLTKGTTITGKAPSYLKPENITAEINSTSETPTSFSLGQNYPNPFNPETQINYSIPKQTFVELKVYNMLGEVVTILISKFQNPGNYSYLFNASNLPSGIYFYQIATQEYKQTKKMLLLK